MVNTETSHASTSCGSVKKQVLIIEKRVKTQIFSLSKYGGVMSRDKVIGRKAYEEYVKLGLTLKSIWKLGTNNPNCFTNTQGMLIREKPFNPDFLYGFFSPLTYISYLPLQIPQFSMYFSENYNSIYSY